MTQTPVSGSESLSSPDLVSIPNNNFVWQGYNFQPSNMATGQQATQQDVSANTQMQDFNMAMDMDLGISFDDLFGNRPNGAVASNEDWMQWMNVGV